jgi:pimeloyl-ACP methyl ester carboxylesterase
MQLSIVKARQWLIHGTSDDDVPPAFSRDYADFKRNRTGDKKEDARLIEVTGAEHLDLIDPHTQAWKEVEKAVSESTA